MRLGSIVSPAMLSLLVGSRAAAASASPVVRQTKGSLSLVDNEPLFTFKYSTEKPDKDNWIGLYYATAGGPDDEEFVRPSLVWEYVDKAEGTVHLSTDGLEPGSYKAYFLYDGGYTWLAEPVVVDLLDNGPLSFMVDKAVLHNARRGDEFEARIDGLQRGGGNSTIKFSLAEAEGGDWVRVDEDGTITGTPKSGDADTQITVEATSSDGSTARLPVSIPVREAGQPLVEELRVMTYNLWHGGTQVNNYHAKQVRFLVDSNVDVVAFQESTGDHALRLANALGWHGWQGSDVGIASRYPFAEVYPEGDHGGAVRIALDGEDSQVNLWNVHLGYDPYGPYDFCFDGMTVDQVLEREEESKRTPQIEETVKDMKDHIDNADNIPVLLAGDFNAPSHLDWTEKTKDQHCGVGDVPWPTSKRPIEAGLMDSFREVHPDPLREPGLTWSPIFLENEGRPEPLDRIDFVYHKGVLEPLKADALVVGDPKPEPDHKDNEWTSDHKAVMIVYKVL